MNKTWALAASGLGLFIALALAVAWSTFVDVRSGTFDRASGGLLLISLYVLVRYVPGCHREFIAMCERVES